MAAGDTANLDAIEFGIKSNMVLSNPNRARIMHFLDICKNKECQAEKIATELGLSHRTVLYHLDLLHDIGCVEVRMHKKRGEKLVRSVWGINSGNNNIQKILEHIRRKVPAHVLNHRSGKKPRSGKSSQ